MDAEDFLLRYAWQTYFSLETRLDINLTRNNKNTAKIIYSKIGVALELKMNESPVKTAFSPVKGDTLSRTPSGTPSL
jgi:hypothetical protein